MFGKVEKRARAITIFGDAGLGKTTLGASFPAPVFIRAEDGLASIPEEIRPDAGSVVKSSSDIFSQIGWLIQNDHNYQTAVIDSVTALENIFAAEILASDPKRPASLNQALGGYGAGFGAVARLHQRVRAGAEKLIERGIHVVFLGHAGTENIDLPDQDPFVRYSLRMHKSCLSHYVDNVDFVGFLRLQVFTLGDGDKKKAKSDGSRVLVCYPTPSNVSKNRFGITEDLIINHGENPLIPYL